MRVPMGSPADETPGPGAWPRIRHAREPEAVHAMLPATSTAASSMRPNGPNAPIPCEAICAPAMAPSVPPMAMSGNRRSPSASVNRSLASDQNCAMLIVLKMPSQTKNAKPMGTPAWPSPTNASKLATKNRNTYCTSTAGATRLASAL